MADTLTSRIRGATSSGTGAPAVSPADAQLAGRLRSSQEYLDEYKALVEDPQFQRTAPPDTQKTLREAIDRAERLYQEKTDRNDWLEVAQILSRAGAQFAAAQSGMSSDRNMAGLQFGPGVDYGARNERAFREYSTQLRTAGDGADRSRQGFLDTDAARKENFGQKTGYLKEAIDTAKAREADTERYRRAEAAERERAGRDSARQTQQDQREDAREAARLRDLNLRDLASEEKDLEAQLKARQTLVNQMLQEGDLSSKSVNKLQEKYGALAAQAGVDLAQLREQLEREGSKPGVLWGTNPDPEKQQQILSGKIQEVRSLLDAVKTRKSQLLQPGGAPQGDTPAPKGPKEPTTEQVQKYVQLYPQVTEEQARDILRKRLNGQP